MTFSWKAEACGQTKHQLPDRSILKGQKLVESTKNWRFKSDILDNFQTIWMYLLRNFLRLKILNEYVPLKSTLSKYFL